MFQKEYGHSEGMLFLYIMLILVFSMLGGTKIDVVVCLHACAHILSLGLGTVIASALKGNASRAFCFIAFLFMFGSA